MKFCGYKALCVTARRMSSPARIEWRPLIQVIVSRNWRECSGWFSENSAGPGASPNVLEFPHPQNDEYWNVGKGPPPPSDDVYGRLKAIPNSLSRLGLNVWFHVALNKWLRLGEGDTWSVAMPYCVLVNESAILYRKASESLIPTRESTLMDPVSS